MSYYTIHFGFLLIFIRFDSEGSTSSAIIVFENEEAVSTSLLLSKATIDEHLIVVEPATQEILKTLRFDMAEVDPKKPVRGVATRDATSTIASLIASGYRLSDTASEEAKKLDERWSISNTLKTAFDGAKENIISFDEKYQISEKAKTITNSALDSAKDLSDKLHITETSSNIGETANSWFGYIASSIQGTLETASQKGSEFVENNFGGVVQKFREITNNFSDEVENIKKEANVKYEEGKEKPSSPDVELDSVTNEDEPIPVEVVEEPTEPVPNPTE